MSTELVQIPEVRTWEECSVLLMGYMLRDRDMTGASSSWSSLVEHMKEIEGGVERGLPNPSCLMLCLLTFTAALAHHARYPDEPLPELDDLIEAYHLSYLVNKYSENQKTIYDACYYLNFIMRKKAGDAREYREQQVGYSQNCYDQIRQAIQTSCGSSNPGGLSPDMTLRELLDWIITWNQSESTSQNLLRPAYDLLLNRLNGVQNGSPWDIEEILTREYAILAEKGEGIWGAIALAQADREEAVEKLSQSPFAQEVLDQLANGVRQIILTGAPGTGKTYTATLIARALGSRFAPDQPPYTLVQFHPSYDYTDFVEGLRPVQIEQNGERKVEFVKLDGTFKAFCRQVAALNNPDPEARYFFIIDEINRAELSKVFGELMYCLESDKRGADHLVKTQYQNLTTYAPSARGYLEGSRDCFAGGFYIPESVCIIGTMNDIDRSVESMDFALRRRFEFMELKVEDGMLEKAFEAMGFGDKTGALVRHVQALNRRMLESGGQYSLNRQYCISQGQFAHLPEHIKNGDLKDILSYVWTYRIESLLGEYLRGVNEQEILDFASSCRRAFFTGGGQV